MASKDKQASATKEEDSGSPRRKRLSRPERRQQIIDSAQEVFVRSGLSGTRTRELARAAGVNEATLFAHFSSKEDLFDAAVLQPLRDAVGEEVRLAEARQAAKSKNEPQRINREGHDRFLRALVRSYPLLITALFSDRERGQKLYNEHIYPMIETLAEVTRKNLPSEKVQKLDPKMLTLLGFGMHFMVATDNYFRNTNLDVDEVVSTMSELLAEGLLDD